MRKLTAEEAAHEVAAITTRKWPATVVLPVKNLYDKDHGLPRTGVIYRNPKGVTSSADADSAPVKPTVFENADIFTVVGRALMPPDLRQFSDVKVLEFESVQAMVDAGWVAD